MLPGGIYLLGENFIIFLCCLLSSEMGERKNRAGKNKCDACGKHRIGARLEMKGHGSQKPWQEGSWRSQRGVQHLGMGAGCRHSTRQGWLDPTPCSHASVPLYVVSHSGDIWCPPGWKHHIGVAPDGSHFPPALSLCEDGGKEGLQPSSHPHQQPAVLCPP